MNIVRQRKPFERKWARQIRRALHSSWREVLDIRDYTNIGKKDIDILVKRPVMEETYIKLYKDVGVYFAGLEQSKFKRRGLRLETKDNWTDIWSEQLESYAVNDVGRRITFVTEYTREVIWNSMGKVINGVREEGISISMATDRIQKELLKTVGEVERWRAMRIAQTEVMTASNRGSYESAKSLNIPMLQYWVVSGNNTRDTHYQAQRDNDQGVPMDGTFLVGGMQAKMPGDPILPAGEVINCHCAVIRQPM